MPVFDTSIQTKIVDGSTDLGGKGWVLKDYIIEVYPNLAPDVKTPALWGWGNNDYGGLGINSTGNRSSPVQTVTGGTKWKQVACGYGMTAAIKTDGTLWAWGLNSSGELGDNTTTNRSSPVQTVVGGTWNYIACGYRFTIGIKTDMTLWAWGANDWGQLGNNTTVPRSSPVQTIAGGTNWVQAACTHGGFRASAAIKADGTLWTWGRNTTGQLGDNTTTPRSSPVQTVTGGTTWKQVACGYGITAAVKTDGTLWLWGQNYQGQIGDGTTTRRTSPVQTVSAGTTWKQVACGYRHCVAVKTDGTLWAWGVNSSGELGDGTVTNRASPVQTVARGSTWKQVACTGAFSTNTTAAIKADGTLWTWGANSYGRLGDNTTVTKSSPVQTVDRGTTWKQVAGGHRLFAAIADGNY